MRRRGAGLVKRQLAELFFGAGHEHGRAELLLVAVDDQTLATYCRALERFLDWCDDTGEVPAAGVRGIDMGLALYFSAVCFDENKLPHVAATTLSAVLHFRPRWHGKLACAARALRAFNALLRSPERLPFSHRSVGALFAGLCLRGELEAFHASYYSYHVVGRGEQDWAPVRASDLHLPHDAMDPIGITLGVAARGEKTKTGFNQGALIRDPYLKKWLRERVCSLRRTRPAANGLVFKITPQEYRRAFSGTCAAVGLPRETPHVLRHTAATELWARGNHFLGPKVKTINELKAAGRWQGDDSVKRYTKPHLIAAHEALLAPEVLAMGADFWAHGPEAFIARGRLSHRQD